MNIKKRSILSVLLVAAMIFTVVAFTACGEKVPPVEPETRSVYFKVTGSNGLLEEFEGEELKWEITGLPSELTIKLFLSSKLNL